VNGWWDAPFWALIAAAIAVLVWRPALVLLYRLFWFFGIGDVEASAASAILLATTGLVGLIYNQLAPEMVLSSAPLHLLLGFATGAGAGLAMTWLSARENLAVGTDRSDPPGPPPPSGPGPSGPGIEM
jgi:hypothetical protein